MNKVTVGLICHNEVDNIDSCLAEILSQENLNHIHEVIVVDNSSTDGTAQRLTKWSQKYTGLIRIFKSEKNLVGQARQTVVDHCETEFLLFTDADCLVPKDWIYQHLKNIENAGESVAGVCAPNRLPELHDWQIALNHFMSTPFGHGGSPQAMTPDTPLEVDHLPTTNALFRISAIKITNGFRPRLMVGEDAELGKQLASAGFKMIMFPRPLVINHSAKSFREWCARMRRFGSAQWTHSPLRSLGLLLLFPLTMPFGALAIVAIPISAFFLLRARAGSRMALLSAYHGMVSLIFYGFGFFLLS